MTAKGIAQELGATGLCICPGFLSAKSLVATANDLDAVHAQGKFRNAHIGHGDLTEGVRCDETYWLERKTQNPAQARLWMRIDLLQRALNRNLFLGLGDFEGHYSAYPRGGFYQRHLDCHRGTSKRIVSVIIYLNRDWVAADGGQLRVYDEDSFQDVDPIGGTMVCFMSQESEHEVLLSHRRRASFSGWFLTS